MTIIQTSGPNLSLGFLLCFTPYLSSLQLERTFDYTTLLVLAIVHGNMEELGMLMHSFSCLFIHYWWSNFKGFQQRMISSWYQKDQWIQSLEIDANVSYNKALCQQVPWFRLSSGSFSSSLCKIAFANNTPHQAAYNIKATIISPQHNIIVHADRLAGSAFFRTGCNDAAQQCHADQVLIGTQR